MSSMCSRSFGPAAAALRRSAALRPLATSLPVVVLPSGPAYCRRSYAADAKGQIKYQLTEAGKVLDPYLRPSWPPLPTNKNALNSLIQYGKNLAMSTFYAARLKKDLLAIGTAFDATAFPIEVEHMYKAMNSAFATGKPYELEPYVTPLMFSTLKSQMRKRPAKLQWEYLGALERPKIVNLVYAKSELDTFGVAQIIVKIHSHQRLTVSDNTGKIIKVSESKPVEYLVVERFTTPEGMWRISAKVEPPQEQ